MAPVAGVSRQAVGVAGSALAVCAFVIHWEGMGSVIGCGFPRAGGMAGGAIRAELTKVLGWFGVTGGTFAGRALIHAVFVTGLATYICMGAVQFESREAVIERGWRPAFGRMAGFAGCAVLAAMRVVSLMTGVAILRGGSQVADFACVDMTQAAIRLGVFASQRKT